MPGGAAILAAVKWGLKDDGIACVAVMLVALVGARLLSYAPAGAVTSPDGDRRRNAAAPR